MEEAKFSFENNKRAENACRNFITLLKYIEAGQTNLAPESLWSPSAGIEITDPGMGYILELQRFVDLVKTPEVTAFISTLDKENQKIMNDGIIRAEIYLHAFNK